VGRGRSERRAVAEHGERTEDRATHPTATAQGGGAAEIDPSSGRHGPLE